MLADAAWRERSAPQRHLRDVARQDARVGALDVVPQLVGAFEPCVDDELGDVVGDLRAVLARDCPPCCRS